MERSGSVILEREPVYVVGDDDYVSSRLTDIMELVELVDYTFDATRLTPAYSDTEEHRLLRLASFRAVNSAQTSRTVVRSPLSRPGELLDLLWY